MKYPMAIFGGDVSLISAEEGGRRRAISSGYRCQMRFPAERGIAGDWDAMVVLWVVELSPGASAQGLLIPPASHDLWHYLNVPVELGLYEGYRQIGAFDVLEKYTSATKTSAI